MSKFFGLAVSRASLALSRWSGWLRVAAIGLISLLGLGIVLNGALNLGGTRPFLASLISVSPQSLNVDYRRVWFIWPTLVYVKELEVRGSDANVQWQLEVAEARLSIDVTALFKREFRATRVLARGVTFRLRQKLDPRAATNERMAALPPIPDIGGPPIIEAGPPEPDIPNDKYKLWSVMVENVDGRARQIWIDEFRFDGDALVTGAFFLQPKRWLWVGPAKATLVSGKVTVGATTALENTSGTVTCMVPPFDPRLPTGIEFFRYMSGTFQLDASIPNARALDYYTRIRGSSASFNGGSGGIHLEGALHSGIVRPLNLSFYLNELKAQNEPWMALGSLRLSAKAATEGASIWLAHIAPVELRHADAKAAAIQGAELRFNASTDLIDISQPLPAIELHGDLTSAQIPDLRIVNTFIPKANSLHVDGGRGSLSAHFDANSGTNQANGEVRIGAAGLSAHDGSLYFGGNVSSSATIAKMRLDSGDFDVSRAHIETKNVTLDDSNARISDWWSSVEIRNAKLRPSQRIPLDVTWTAKLKNATPVLAFSKRSPSIPGWVTRFFAGGEVETSGRLQVGVGFVELSQLKAETGLLTVEGHFREQGGAKSGLFQIAATPFSVGIELKNEDTKVILVGSAVEPPLEAPGELAGSGRL